MAKKKAKPEEVRRRKIYADRIVLGDTMAAAAKTAWPDIKNPVRKANKVSRLSAVKNEIAKKLEAAGIKEIDVLKRLKEHIDGDNAKVSLTAVQYYGKLMGYERHDFNINPQGGNSLIDQVEAFGSLWLTQAFIKEVISQAVAQRIFDGELSFADFADAVDAVIERNNLRLPKMLQGDRDAMTQEEQARIYANRAEFARMEGHAIDAEFTVIEDDDESGQDTET